MSRHINPQELFQAVEFYNNSGLKVIERHRYLALAELLEPQKAFELADKRDTGVVYVEESGDEDTPASYWAMWFSGGQYEEEVRIDFILRTTTPHQALDCVVEQMKAESQGEQDEAEEANS